MQDLINQTPDGEQAIFGGRARSATDANVLRRKGRQGVRGRAGVQAEKKPGGGGKRGEGEFGVRGWEGMQRD